MLSHKKKLNPLPSSFCFLVCCPQIIPYLTPLCTPCSLLPFVADSFWWVQLVIGTVGRLAGDRRAQGIFLSPFVSNNMLISVLSLTPAPTQHVHAAPSSGAKLLHSSNPISSLCPSLWVVAASAPFNLRVPPFPLA